MRYSPRFSQKSEQLMQKESSDFRRAVTTSVQEAKPPRYTITEEQWGTLKNLKQDKSMVVHMADSGIGIVLLDTDPYHAMKTPLIEIALSQFIKGDQTRPYELLTIREASQAESMSEAVNNKVRPDTDIPLRGNLVFMLKKS